MVRWLGRIAALLVPHSAAAGLFLRFRKMWPFQDLVGSRPVPSRCWVLPGGQESGDPGVGVLSSRGLAGMSRSRVEVTFPFPLLSSLSQAPGARKRGAPIPYPSSPPPRILMAQPILVSPFPMLPWTLWYWMALPDAIRISHLHTLGTCCPCCWGSWCDGFPAHQKSGVQGEPPSWPLTQLLTHPDLHVVTMDSWASACHVAGVNLLPSASLKGLDSGSQPLQGRDPLIQLLMLW